MISRTRLAPSTARPSRPTGSSTPPPDPPRPGFARRAAMFASPLTVGMLVRVLPTVAEELSVALTDMTTLAFTAMAENAHSTLVIPVELLTVIEGCVTVVLEVHVPEAELNPKGRGSLMVTLVA